MQNDNNLNISIHSRYILSYIEKLFPKLHIRELRYDHLFCSLIVDYKCELKAALRKKSVTENCHFH